MPPRLFCIYEHLASMKVPPKRKGNWFASLCAGTTLCLNESPSEKEGKSVVQCPGVGIRFLRLNESPSEKEGKFAILQLPRLTKHSLNESPSEKEGKLPAAQGDRGMAMPQ